MAMLEIINLEYVMDGVWILKMLVSLPENIKMALKMGWLRYSMMMGATLEK